MNHVCRRPRLRRPGLLATLMLAVLAAAGCGPSGPKRYEISGTITLKGSPIEEGVIFFEPMEKQPTREGATILNSKYVIPQKKGLGIGKYRVTLYAGDGSPNPGQGMAGIDPKYDPKPGKGFRGKGIERVPPEYNMQSKLVFEVTASGENQFNFDVP